MIGIYKVLCVKTSEFYIGSSVNISSRKASHFYRLRLGNHPNPILQNKYNKYKEFEFIVIEECSKEDLLKREQFYIDSLNPSLNCNLIAGKPPRISWTPERKQKMSLAKQGKSHKNKRVYSKEGLERVIRNTKKLFSNNKGENHPVANLSETDVLLIRKLLMENILYISDIAERFNVSIACINDIKYNRSWTHLDPLPKINSKKKLRSLSKKERINKSMINNLKEAI